MDQQVGLRFEARAGDDLACREAIIERGLDQQYTLALLAVVVCDRQEIERLCAVHRAIAEVEFGHRCPAGP